MGRYEMSLENLDRELRDMTVDLGPRAGKKVKPGKKEKKRGSFTFQYQFLPFGALSTLLLDQYAQILEVIVTKTPHDGVATALIGIFQSDLQRLGSMMRTALTYEVNQTPSSEQLFRTDSMTTKLMKASSKLLGSLWLYDALQSYISQICSANECLEVDPAKATGPVDVEQNMIALTTSCKDILSAILNSFSKVPAPIQDLIRMIAEVVGAKFPESKIQAISGYVFLRFFGPGISSPDVFGFGVEPGENARRHLILIAKVIQSIANGTSTREEFLKPLAPWIEEQHSIVNNKLLELCGHNAAHPLPIPHQSSQSLLAHYGALVSWVTNNQPVLDRHGVSPQDYEALKSNLAPYARALAALPKEDGSSKSACFITNFTRAISKR